MSVLFFHMLIIGFAGMFILMTVVWIIHRIIKNAGIVDIAWAGGLALLAIAYYFTGNGYAPRKLLITLMVVFWGSRLAWFLFNRVVGHPEEGRYQQIRKDWKTNIDLKFFFFFQFQALLDVILSLPFLLICLNSDPHISLLEWSGAVIWCIALVGEATADAQLKKFKSDPANKGKICQSGLWKYSRHPNYFFEWLIWVAFFITALSSPYGWISFIGPVLMLYFLLKVTGIPATEAQALRTKGEAYRQYQRTTSVFVPWFRRTAHVG